MALPGWNCTLVALAVWSLGGGSAPTVSLGIAILEALCGVPATVIVLWALRLSGASFEI